MLFGLIVVEHKTSGVFLFFFPFFLFAPIFNICNKTKSKGSEPMDLLVPKILEILVWEDYESSVQTALFERRN
jgi:hypothetical protein